MGLFGNVPRGVWNSFPYTNFHDLNLDWVLKLCRFTAETLEELPGEIDKVVQEKLEEYVTDQKADIIETILGADQSVNVMQLPDPNLPAFDNGGLQDNTAAWEALVQWMQKNGRRAVYLPSGTYLMSSFTPPENFAIIGDGRYQTTIKAARYQVSPLITGSIKGFLLDGVTLDMNDAEQGQPMDIINGTFDGALLTNFRTVGGKAAVAVGTSSTGHLQISDMVAIDCVTGINLPASSCAVNIDGLNIQSKKVSTGLSISGNNHVLRAAVINATTAAAVTGNQNTLEWAGVSTYTNTGTNNSFRVNSITLSDDVESITRKSTSTTDTVTGTRTSSAAEENNTVSGTMTTSAGARTDTTTGHHDTTAGAVYVTTTSGDEVHDVAQGYAVTADEVTVTGEQGIELDATGANLKATGDNATIEGTTTATVTGGQVVIDSTQPMKYKTPTVLNDNFKAVQMQGQDGNNYNVLVQGETWPPEGGGGGGGGETTDPNAIHTTGGTMTGALTMSGANINMQNGATVTGIPTPTTGTDAASKAYVDQAVADVPKGDFLPLTGGTVTGNLGVAPTGETTSTVIKGNGIEIFDSAGQSIGTLLLNDTSKLWTAQGNGLVVGTGAQSNTLKLTGNSVETVTSAGDTQSGLVLGNGEISAGNARLTLVGTPTAGTDATTKQYVDDAIAGIDVPTGDYLPLTGGTLTGRVDFKSSLNTAGTTIENGLIAYTPPGSTAAQTMITFSQANINCNNNTLSNIKSPTNNNDAANKAYVDSKALPYMFDKRIGGSVPGTYWGVTWSTYLYYNYIHIYCNKSPTPDVTQYFTYTFNFPTEPHSPSLIWRYSINTDQFPAYNISGKYAGTWDTKVTASSKTSLTIEFGMTPNSETAKWSTLSVVVPVAWF